jgi:hypothetical protein
LLLIHLGNVDDLHDILLLCLFRLHEHGIPEASLAYNFDLAIFLHSNYIVNLITSHKKSDEYSPQYYHCLTT